MEFREFALVVEPKAMADLTGRECWGVCRYLSNHMEHAFLDADEVPEFVGSLPTVPRMEGYLSTTVPFDLEMEALSALVDSAAEETRPDGTEIVPGFFKVEAPCIAGLTVFVTEFGVEFAFSPHLSRALGVEEGDRVCLCVDGGGRRLAIALDESGIELVASSDDVLRTAHAHPLPILPFPVKVGSVLQPAYILREGYLVFEAAVLDRRWERGSAVAPPMSDASDAGIHRDRRSAAATRSWSLILLAALGYCFGWVAAL